LAAGNLRRRIIETAAAHWGCPPIGSGLSEARCSVRAEANCHSAISPENGGDYFMEGAGTLCKQEKRNAVFFAQLAEVEMMLKPDG
jgi:hypothetical protein